VHSCLVSQCRVAGNAREHGHAQVDVLGDAHDLVFSGNEIRGSGKLDRAGLYLAPTTERIWLEGNRISGSSPAIVGTGSLGTVARPAFACGQDSVLEVHYRHLP
jgi:hypothetical protein